MRIYEELFIAKPDAADEEVDQFVEQLRTQLTTAGATVDKVVPAPPVDDARKNN